MINRVVERKRMKIHFVDFGDEFDEWLDCGVHVDQLPFTCLEKNYVPDQESWTGGKYFMEI